MSDPWTQGGQGQGQGGGQWPQQPAPAPPPYRPHFQMRGPIDDREAAHARAKRRIGMGLFWLVLGIVVTAATYDAASSGSGGGTYVVMWGAIVYGIVDIIRGIAGLAE